MQSQSLIRILNIKQYNTEQQKFRGDKIFAEHRGGVSLFCEDCARSVSSDCICCHAENYYYSTTDHLPYLLWRISVEDLTTFIQPETAVFDDKPSTIPSKKDNTFDKCHVDIQNISDDKREEFANIYCKPPNIYICIEGEEVPLDEPEFRNLKNWTKEKGYFKEKGRYT